MRKLIVVFILLTSAVTIGWIFWSQELKYVLPTPVPAHYSSKAVQQSINLSSLHNFKNNKPAFLHFFNPDCPCSRFNLQHFTALVKMYSDSVQVYAIVPAYADLEKARNMIDSDDVTVLQDTSESLAMACGVYSTPQAVVIDADQKLFFRGNYNKSRYCTIKETNYAAIALHALVTGQAPPIFNSLATQSYGCELPDTTKNSTNLLVNLFQ